MSSPIIRLGISSCLLGERVRWDGGHKRDPWIADQLGSFVRYYPICPEVGCGFGVPREPLRLVGDPHAPRLVTLRTQKDHTVRMLQWARRMVKKMQREELDGFVFKGKSPSCGIKGVRIYGVQGKGASTSTGQGLFARAFREHFPLIPIEDEGRLHNPQHSANFIERCFVMKEWRDGERRRRRSSGEVVRFHRAHTLLILSHSPGHYRSMGKLVVGARTMPAATLNAEYQQLLLETLRLMATPAKHVHVLQHIMGYFKKKLSGDERQELQELIDRYRQGQVSLSVPINRINHYVRLCDLAHLRQQRYLFSQTLQLQVQDLI